MSNEKVEQCKQSLEWHKEANLLATQSYNKAILSLATASLGFTFAFIKFGYCYGFCLLIFVWVSLIISIVSILLSFIFDQIHTSHRIKYLYYCIDDFDKKGNEKNKATPVKQTHWTDDLIFNFQIISGSLLVLGILLFTIFVGINI